MKKLSFISLACLSTLIFGCNLDASQQKSDSGVAKATTVVQTDANGRTIEQENIIERLHRDNTPGSVKHLYVISSYTGDVLQYSTVKGKVTSGNKRLSPKTVDNSAAPTATGVGYNSVNIGSGVFVTSEVLDDGGAYGDSGNYLFWFDAQGNYHQYYPAGGTYLHISDRPLRIRKANFSVTMETDTTSK